MEAMSMSSSPMAIQMREYGPPGVLSFDPVKLAPLARGEVRVATRAAAVNRTDLEIRAGGWPIRRADPFPYVPGVEVVGDIVEIGEAVDGWSLGQTVITMMQGLGGVRAERPGGYARYVTTPAESLAPAPRGMDPLVLAALGLPAVTAHQGLRRLGPLQGRRVLVTGAAGGVGSAATALASAAGARVTAVIARAEQADYVRALGAEEVVVAARDAAPDLPAATFDGVLDTVGGPTFAASVVGLSPEGVLSLVGAVGGGPVSFDAWDLIRPVVLTGYSTETLTGEELRQSIAMIGAGVESGHMRPPRFATLPLAAAPEAHARLEAGGVSGRLLLVGDHAG